MNLIKKVKQNLAVSTPELQRLLVREGLDISIQALDKAEKTEAESPRIRFDLLCTLRKVSSKSWTEFGKWLDEEFLK